MQTKGRILPATAEAIAEAAALLKAGGLVAFPTETVYGLGADATSDAAVARIFAAKRRPQFNPLISHLPDRAAAAELAVFDGRAEALAQAFWPGALTLVLPRTRGCPIARLTSSGLDSIALRVPAHPIAQALLAAVGCPVAAPSANPSGRLSPTRAEHVAAALGGEVDLILDGGPCQVGLESTVVDLTGPQPLLLRAGGVTREATEQIIGPLVIPAEGEAAPASPGRLLSHYAPDLPLRLDATSVRPDEALLAFGSVLSGAAATRNLSTAGDLVEAAANLFQMLRELDQSGLVGIAVMPVPEHGLGAAINDRLRRAAAPRN
jgi:L-threonylcarbamoyladenylate synthase